MWRTERERGFAAALAHVGGKIALIVMRRSANYSPLMNAASS